MDVERGRTAIKEKANHPVVTVGLIIFLALNVAMLVVGFLKKDECPVDEKIPIYLIVAGAVGILSKLLPICNRKLDWCLVDLVISVLYIFEIIWVILGSIWVYSIYKPSYQPSRGNYCNKTAYLMSFSLLTIHWIFLGVAVVLACCCCCCRSKK